MIKTCEHCEKEFETERTTKKFCSPSCKTMSHMRKKSKNLSSKICKCCHEEFQPKWKEAQECCSRICQTTYVNNKPEVAAKKSKVLRENGNLKGEKNPSFGKVYSKEMREYLSKKNKEYFKHNDNAFKGQTHSAETKKQMSDSAKIRSRTDEARDKMSKWNVERILANDGVNPSIGHHKHGTHTSIKANGDIKYDSSYELQAYKILDSLSKVKSYSRCNFYIEYEHKSKTRRYIPDILITYTDGTQEVIEIKPESMLDDAVNQSKFAAAEKYCQKNLFGFNIWSEDNLF